MCGSCEISVGVAEGRVSTGLFVEGDIVVMALLEEDEDVSPAVGRVDVLSCVILNVCGVLVWQNASSVEYEAVDLACNKVPAEAIVVQRANTQHAQL